MVEKLPVEHGRRRAKNENRQRSATEKDRLLADLSFDELVTVFMSIEVLRLVLDNSSERDVDLSALHEILQKHVPRMVGGSISFHSEIYGLSGLLSRLMDHYERGNFSREGDKFYRPFIEQDLDASRELLLHGLAPGTRRQLLGRAKNKGQKESLLKLPVHVVPDIQAAWKADTSLSALSRLPIPVLERAAWLAADVVAKMIDVRSVEEFVDSVSGLALPPKLAKPYRERGHHEDGKRLSVFEHLSQEYPEYLKHHLLFSGHIQTMDRPAYEALIYLANKEAAERKIKKRASHLAEFLWRHGILAGEHLNEPPKGVERQAAVIKALQDKRKMIGVSNALASKFEKGAHSSR